MDRKGLLYLSFILLVGIAALWGCPINTGVTTSPEAQTEKVSPSAAPASTTEATTAEAKSGMKSEGANDKSGAIAEGLKPIYFDFDQAIIRDDAIAIMKANAEWLKANPKAKIKIEGNCDEGENSRALSKRRAASAKKYLTSMGISGRRISLISHGKEKPFCSEHDETCLQKKRRDDFIVAGK